jgi:hypothetical protein
MATEEPFFGFEKIKGAPNLHYYWNGKLIQNLASIFYLLEYMFDIIMFFKNIFKYFLLLKSDHQKASIQYFFNMKCNFTD